ncbi:bifunctional hydroxymethylpyrimidine kinase/phosphomethylpyrimidine kinase [Breoghania sp.]|uniref:bifunctional hydroxymethylpyrimidine kinase/phosphomethylpyrimidine kinase n=1 Tax=Breoghania sp. TaxID=2065378 RepID=UPI0026159E1C|nr:bifunctional hydroxymethylpyrimidine kinase/phosphomethylpyrimidine kinase [Breoghania sp.]MDJ0931220.1 bifunctional hydroxymethylpyrimidine kinase/phosphomethylpyrimidine kinase [Breoghania sp.]
MTSIAVTIAGSDSGGGAGIQADLKTFSALGVYGASVIAALTAQNTRGVTGIHDVPSDFVTAQIDAVYSDLKVDATKIGMLSRIDTIEAVASGLERWDVKNVVLDPVMVATSGDHLIVDDAVSFLVERLFLLADFITPNLREAARILDAPVAETRETMRDQALKLKAMGPGAVLLKGGHGMGGESADLLLDKAGEHWYEAARIATNNTHGTGCTLSSAIAAGCARGLSLSEAVGFGKDYVTAAIAAADTLHIGQGHGPVHHFHAFWKETT